MAEKLGRPALYTVELADQICDRISSGESLRQVCRDESMPCTTTVMKWAREIPEFTQQYAKAREALLEHWAEEIIDIADDGTNDWMRRQLPSGEVEEVVRPEHINRSRLRVDTRKWLLSKLVAKKYGDRVAAEISGPDGGPIETQQVGELELARRIALILDRATHKPD